MEAETQRVDARYASVPTGEDWLAHAVDAFARASALRPDDPGIAAKHAMAARYACAWREADGALAVLSTSPRIACEPMTAVALLADATTQRDAIAAFTYAHASPAAPAIVRQRGTRLRVGYLSTDFHDHATAHLAAGLFECHDASRFETFAYAADRDDGSAMRRRLRAAFAHWRDVRELTDPQAAGLMRKDALDVLVDLKGHTRGTRLPILDHRPAPVQLHYLGFPGTLAHDGVDGTIVDATVAPDDAEFAERALRLPVCYQANDHRRALPPSLRREEAGLPADAMVLACFNQTYKLTEPFVRAWLEVMREHDHTVLWLTVPHALAQRNLIEFVAQSGIGPARVIFAPIVDQATHLARLQCADLALDVLPYGSHTTGSDALFAGVPAPHVPRRDLRGPRRREPVPSGRAFGPRLRVAGRIRWMPAHAMHRSRALAGLSEPSRARAREPSAVRHAGFHASLRAIARRRCLGASVPKGRGLRDCGRNASVRVSATYTRAATGPSGLASTCGLGRLAR
jgi:predicted O-linked N-acetylglucosamine transferase (SPINDLY family)